MYRPPSNAPPQPAGVQPQPKFKVIKALGRGSYGVVYKVQRLADGQEYAMKETDMSKMGHQERSDAVNEIRLLGSLNHPNVVRHHETFLAGNKLCIVMEFAPAGDLAGFIKAAVAGRMALPEATIWQIFLQLCQGMQAIHEACVIHRDIKPANIFMCPGNVVKVGDLGVAKALNKAHYAQTQIGTPVFMAPEVWRGLPYGYSSDLWSLGCVLYEMMTYRLPFDGRSLAELKNRIIAGRFQPLNPTSSSSGSNSGSSSGYSHELVSICHALLSQDARKRPTCAAILNCPEAAKWMHTIPEEARVAPAALLMAPAAAANGALLPTIRVPRDIRMLPSHLPKANYDSDDGIDPNLNPSLNPSQAPGSYQPSSYQPRSYQPSGAGYNQGFAAPKAPLAAVAERPVAVAGRARVPSQPGAARASPRGAMAARAAGAAGVAGGIPRPRSGAGTAVQSNIGPPKYGIGAHAHGSGVLQQAGGRPAPSPAGNRVGSGPGAAVGLGPKPSSRPPSGNGVAAKGAAGAVVPGSHRAGGGGVPAYRAPATGAGAGVGGRGGMMGPPRVANLAPAGRARVH